jgi:hypothetical protein
MGNIAEQPLSLTDKCPQCGVLALELDPEGDIHCWGCGRTFKKPEQHQDYLLERYQFYEKNKAAILADVKAIGEKATAKKWKVHGASLYHLLRRWEREANSILPQEGKKNHDYPKYKRKSATRINNAKKHAYYEANKEAIVADLLNLGRTPTIKRWGIVRNTMYYLEGRWLTEEQRARISPNGPALPASGRPQTSNNGRLPQFPEFSPAWEATVQVKWFEIYEKLFDRHSSENR